MIHNDAVHCSMQYTSSTPTGGTDLGKIPQPKKKSPNHLKGLPILTPEPTQMMPAGCISHHILKDEKMVKPPLPKCHWVIS